jgi:5-aminolevulinate synthase
MEPILKQSRNVCPFLKKTSTSTLRALSTSSSTPVSGGGAMSNLQVVARRCPIMSQAIAVQTGRATSMGSVFAKRPPTLAIPREKRHYVAPTNNKNFESSRSRKAEALDVGEVHRRAGVIDTSKGNF